MTDIVIVNGARTAMGLAPCRCIIQSRQIAMIQRMGTHIEMSRQLMCLRCSHHRRTFAVMNRYIKSRPQTMPLQHIGDAQIQRMAIIHRQAKGHGIHDPGGAAIEAAGSCGSPGRW